MNLFFHLEHNRRGRICLHDGETGTRVDSLVGETTQDFGLIFHDLRDQDHLYGLAQLRIGQPESVLLFEKCRAAGSVPRDRITVLAGARMTEDGLDSLLNLFRYPVLQGMRLLMCANPVHPEHVEEETLCQAVTAQNLLGKLLAGRGERHTLIVALNGIAVRDQPLDRFGGSSARNPKLLGKARANHRLAFHRHVVDRL